MLPEPKYDDRRKEIAMTPEMEERTPKEEQGRKKMYGIFHDLNTKLVMVGASPSKLTPHQERRLKLTRFQIL